MREAAQALGATWYDTTRVATPVRDRLTYDLDVDVCVIGGGLAGLTAARELARRGWSVAVLEADRVGGRASGRNCGFVLPGFGESMPRIVERVGLHEARELWALSDAGRLYVRDTIRETGMPAVDPVDGWLHVAKYADDAALRSEVALLRDRFDAEVEAWPAEHVRATLRSTRYCNGAHYRTAFHIHPLNYALGLAAAAEAAGVRIFELTPAVSLDPAGARKRVVTPAARVRAGQIVAAGNVNLGPLLPQLSASLLPITTFVAVTAPLGPRLSQAIAYSGAVSDTNGADHHYRIVDGDRLLWAGGVRTWESNPQRFRRRLADGVRQVYPQLGEAAIEYVWAGTLGRTVHRMPQIGALTPGLWVASGFGGHGLNTTAMAGQLIARAIAEKDTTWRLFESYELVWAGGVTGRAVVQVGYAMARLRERIKAAMHRRKQRAAALKAARAAAAKSAAEQGVSGSRAGT